MNTRKWLIVSGTVILVMLALAVGISLAQEPEPPVREAGVEGEMDVAAIAPGAIPIQGQLTDLIGNPLDGTYSLTFSLYEVASGGTALCSDTRSVDVEDGLFSDYMDHCYNDIYGQKVWLGIEVESDGEMTDRQVIYPVPYALSLRPGAVISGTYPNVGQGIVHVQQGETGSHGEGHYGAKLVYDDWGWWSAGVHGYARDVGSGVSGHSHAGNYSAGVSGMAYATTTVNYGGYFHSQSDMGYGVYGYADNDSGLNYGVYGKSDSVDGKGVYGVASTSGGIGVEGESQVGTGMYGHSAEGYGVYGDTSAASNNYGLYTNDNLYSANFHTMAARMQIVQNGGSKPLEPGDVVAFSGIGAPLEAGGLPTVQVVEATSANSTAVAGVVSSRFNIEAVTGGPEKLNQEITPEGPIQPGEYMLVVVQGPAQVKASALTASLQPGDLLSSAGRAGYAAKAAEVTFGDVETVMPGTILGKVLEPLDEGEALIYIFVTLQ